MLMYFAMNKSQSEESTRAWRKHYPPMAEHCPAIHLINAHYGLLTVLNNNLLTIEVSHPSEMCDSLFSQPMNHTYKFKMSNLRALLFDPPNRTELCPLTY